MRQQRQGVRSTKVFDDDATLEEFKQTPGVKHEYVTKLVVCPSSPAEATNISWLRSNWMEIT
jgi:hypothetical protein